MTEKDRQARYCSVQGCICPEHCSEGHQGFVWCYSATGVLITSSIALIIIFTLPSTDNLKFHVTNASLTEFNLTPQNTISYNLVLNLTIRNSHKHVTVYFDNLNATINYKKNRLGSIHLVPFAQPPKNTTRLSPSFSGQSKASLSNRTLRDFNQEKNKGVYGVDLKIYLRVREKEKGTQYKDEVRCGLIVPLTLNGSANNYNFETIKCKLIEDSRRHPGSYK